MNFQKLVTFFLLSFLLVGPGGYAQDNKATQAPGASATPPAASTTAASPAVVHIPGQWSDGWYQGAEGYAQAVQEYKKTQKPMVVYISVGWCPYCRKFEKGVLSSPLVMKFMRDKIKVNLNPESGPKENEIVMQYGIRGFPFLFLLPPPPGRAMQLYTSVTPEDFIEFFNEALQ